MNESTQRRPWRKTRWATAVGLWLVVAYPISVGPVTYANARGWLSAVAVAHLEAAYEPLDYVVLNGLPGTGTLHSYTLWAYGLGERHRASPD